jgi:hypothetical protein
MTMTSQHAAAVAKNRKYTECYLAELRVPVLNISNCNHLLSLQQMKLVIGHQQ